MSLFASRISYKDGFVLASAFVGAYLVIQGLTLLKDVLLILLTAIILALATEGMVLRLEARRVSRAASATFLYLFGLVAVIFMLYLFVPPFVAEVRNLLIEYPAYSEVILEEKAEVRFDPMPYLRALSLNMTDTPGMVLTSVLKTFGGLTSFLAVFFIAYFLTLQKGGIASFVQPWIHDRYRESTDIFLKRVQERVGNWLWGKTLSSLIIGFLTFLGLAVLGVPYALSLGVLALVLNYIPFVGPLIASLPALALAVTISIPLTVIVALYYFVLNGVVESFLLGPIFMRQAVEVNPALLIVFVISGAQLGGIFGVIIAIPLSAILYLVWLEYAPRKFVDK